MCHICVTHILPDATTCSINSSPVIQEHGTTTRRAALTQAIKGLGGIGKTQVAVEYAYRSCDLNRYTHTFWINAAGEEALLTSFVALAELLPAFPAKDETDQHKLVEAIKYWLEQCQQRWLLIFDNADDVALVRDYLPQRGNGSILLTTRANAVGALATTLEVETMGFIEGTHLLLRRAQRFAHASDDEINQAGNIVVALDHFLLAIDQAGAYIEETQCSFIDYLTIYQNHRQELLSQRGMLATDYPNSVATTWDLSFQKVQQANPAAAELLHLCAYLSPDRIPEELIREGAVYWPLPLQQAAANLFTFQQTIAELLKFSLVKRLAETHMLSIHRLVQAVLIDTMSQEVQYQWAKRVVLGINDIDPDGNDVKWWPKCQRFLSQVQACFALIERYSLGILEAANLLNRSGVYMLHHALYTLAEPLVLSALSIQERQLGSLHPDITTSLNNLAELYRDQGKDAEAEPLHKRALAINEQQLGANHLDTATTLNNLAILYQHQERYVEAEPLYKRALTIHEQQLGADHPDTARSLGDLAVLYQSLKRYAEAEPLLVRALSIQEQQLGADHPDIVQSLYSLISLYQEQDKDVEAEPLLMKVVSIRKQASGPDTALSLWSLAALYQQQQQYTQAEPLYQQALAVLQRTIGPNHPSTKNLQTHYASLLQAMGCRDEAQNTEETGPDE